MKTFERLFVLGRPASGKSELFDFLEGLSGEERAREYHIGTMIVLDDFVWLWEQFEEDDLWEKATGKRPCGSIPADCGYINTPEQFDFMMAKFDREIARRYLKDEALGEGATLLVEFSRGGPSPYAGALARLRPEIFERAAILYVEVSGEESRRRNESRYQEQLKSSILAHKTPDRIMELYYQNDDWPELTGGRRDGSLALQGVRVPFVTMGNEPESTDPAILAPRYRSALERLWELVGGGELWGSCLPHG